ncbi:MAG: hypothetical protein HRT53_10460 [Colwellia sp.]|nr:hypothetical protein [Colwellia sp.]
MAAFFEGSRGSGKSKYSVERMQNRLKSGRAVATNLDLFLDKLMPDNPKAHYVRLPDFPRSSDLLILDNAYPELDHDDPKTYDDTKFGCVVLDELLTSFNSRTWNDPDRVEVVNWIVQSRKYGWDLCLIGQSIDGVDKQIKETVIDELYSFRSSQNMFGGVIWNIFFKPWWTKLVPKFHICTRYDGRKKDKNQKIGGDHFRRNDLHDCYKTGQQFKKDVRLVAPRTGSKMIEIDDRASYSVLHPHYFGLPEAEELEKSAEQSAETKPEIPKELIAKGKAIEVQTSPYFLLALLVVFSGIYYFINDWSAQQTIKKNKPDIPLSTFDKGDFFTNSVDALKNSDLGQIFINCSQHRSDGVFDYCFNNANGDIVRPENAGYKVLYKSECHAKLVRGKTQLDTYCNPISYSQSEPITHQADTST